MNLPQKSKLLPGNITSQKETTNLLKIYYNEKNFTIFTAPMVSLLISARCFAQDPLAAKYPAFSPYAYCAGDPVNSIDLFGKKEWRINQKGEIVGEENNSQYDMFNYLKDLIPFELLFQ